jgi:hypothetical protein
MKADGIEVSRDEQKNKWLIRIKVGEEVIRRHCDDGKDVDEATLRQAAARTAAEEGYTVDAADIVINRTK